MYKGAEELLGWVVRFARQIHFPAGPESLTRILSAAIPTKPQQSCSPLDTPCASRSAVTPAAANGSKRLSRNASEWSGSDTAHVTAKTSEKGRHPALVPMQNGGNNGQARLLTAAAATTAATTSKVANAATVTPFCQTGAPPPSTDPLPLGPLPGSRYLDAQLSPLRRAAPYLRAA